jgi:hypothetical protein
VGRGDGQRFVFAIAIHQLVLAHKSNAADQNGFARNTDNYPKSLVFFLDQHAFAESGEIKGG